ncbi:hypothetical protein AX15_003046 [Amanita polypyramis BW_CC]|nr:hypothetical protein AX15_003046 [Amanita polypyramis BW_CC]
MTSESESSRCVRFLVGARSSYQQEQNSQDPQPYIDPDPWSDPSHLISIVLNGTTNRGIPTTRRRERELAYAHLTRDELLNKLIDREYEAQRLSKALRLMVQHLNLQTSHITELERDSQEALDRLRQINQSRIEAQQDASRANQELQLYHNELDSSRRELARAADLLRTSQEQREEAEQAAARAREKARKLRQQRLVDAAREEGRRWGFHDGFGRAKTTLAISSDVQATLARGAPVHIRGDSRIEGPERVDDDETEVRSLTPEIIQQTEVRPPSAHSEPGTLHNPFTGSRDRPKQSFTPRRPPQPSGLAPQGLHPPDVLPTTAPPARIGSARPNNPSINTPAISVFRVDLADARQEPRLGFNNRDYYSNNKRPSLIAHQRQELDAPLSAYNKTDSRRDVQLDRASQRHTQVAQRPLLTPQDEKKKGSWYRSFSFRNKFGRRQVIDPDPAHEVEAGNAEEPYTDPDEEEIYRSAPEPPIPWYRTKGMSTGARASKRPSSSFSSVSTHMSQLQLVKTPAVLFPREINGSDGNLTIRSGKEASMVGKLKEKESLLSVIKEDPMSREHTPLTDRFTATVTRPRTPGIPHYPSSSTMNTEIMRGSVGALPNANSSRRQLPFVSEFSGFSGRHRPSTSPVTIQVQTPSHTRTSSADPPVYEELPNRFLSPASVTRSLPRSSKENRFQTSGHTSKFQYSDTPISDRNLSHQTSAMGIKESYLSRNADVHMTQRRVSSPRTSRAQEQHVWGPGGTQVASILVGGDAAAHSVTSLPDLDRQTLARNESNVSLRSLGSYARFDPTTYVDPAFFEPNAEPRHPLEGGVPTRPGSSASGLSYVSERK